MESRKRRVAMMTQAERERIKRNRRNVNAAFWSIAALAVVHFAIVVIV